MYTVYEPPSHISDTASRADEMTFVKDRFSRATAIFGPLWLLLAGHWAGLGVYLAAAVVLSSLISLFGLGVEWFGYAFGSLNLIAAYEEPALRGIMLEAAGWRQVGAVDARNLEEAEFRFFSNWLPGAGDQTTSGMAPDPAGQLFLPVTADVIARVPTMRRHPRSENQGK